MNPTHGDPLLQRISRTALLVLAIALFFLIPAKVVSYGYLPPDDALRHSAYAVTDREWGDIMLLNPSLRSDTDVQAGWNSFLRAVHKVTDWSPTKLTDFSVIAAFFVFAISGLVASGNSPSWLLACAVMAIVEPALFGKLLLGRPLFLTMAAVVILNFVWMRDRQFSQRIEWVIVFLTLAVNITGHSSAWYLWLIAVPPLVACGRWASLRIFATAWMAAIAVACLVNGPYNGVVAPLMALKLGLLEVGTYRSNLVGELQPSGGPWLTLIPASIIIAVRCLRGSTLRSELFRVDVCFVILAWTLGLYVWRFWSEWGLPAFMVWLTLKIDEALDMKPSGLEKPIETLGVFAFAAVIFYVSETVDIRGRYTSVLRSPFVWAPAKDLEAEMPEKGGILYSTEMNTFYTFFHRLPHAPFKYALAMEAGFMRPEDQKVYRAVQFSGKLEEYKPWFNKMTTKDRIFLQSGAKPEWPGIEFRKFYTGWMGRKSE